MKCHTLFIIADELPLNSLGKAGHTVSRQGDCQAGRPTARQGKERENEDEEGQELCSK